jgi:murein DD-endopeptidase MepM/ murein hydrolase activator NlpD
MPFSQKFMNRAPALVAAGLIRKHSSNEFSRGTYILPVEAKVVTEVGSKGISPTHQYQMKNSIDFFVPDGTPIFAAASGVVVEMMKSSDMTGMTIKHWYKGNHVELHHPQFDEYTWYEHLHFNEVYVKIGDKVKVGTIIGLSGNTGFSEVPHLHFQVTQYPPGENWLDFVTVKARFDSIKGLPMDPYAKND